MSSGRQTVRDLVEEAKKRIVLLFICVIGLSYLMSLTSSSVLVNLPAAASLVLFIRYISYDLEMRRRNVAPNKYSSPRVLTAQVPFEASKVLREKSDWRRKVDSPAVEAAVDQFSRHLVSEWVTDLWYSRLTPDKDGPEELVGIINGVLGEISCRVREINLIDLLTRDIIDLLCRNLELYRAIQSKICSEEADKLMTIKQRDLELKRVLASENKLHPALFSAKAEHKVLQHLMEGLISFAFKPEDLQCSFFRYTAREILACAVMRPVLNLANPRFINERIENLVYTIRNRASKKNTPSTHDSSQSQTAASSKSALNQFSTLMDRSNKGLELVQLKHNQSGLASPLPLEKISFGKIGAYQTSDQGCKDIQPNKSAGEWGQMLDAISHRRTQALAPEHFDNMWTKGRNYRRKEVVNKSVKQVSHSSLQGETSKCKTKDRTDKFDTLSGKTVHDQSEVQINGSRSQFDKKQLSQPFLISSRENVGQDPVDSDESEVQTESSYATEDDESRGVTGLDSPGTKVWDSSNRSAAGSHIRHPLEPSVGHPRRQSRKGHAPPYRLPKSHSGRKKHKSSRQKLPVWQEVERTSFPLGDGLDILNAFKDEKKGRESTDESEVESWGRVNSGAAASSSAPSVLSPEACDSSMRSSGYSVLADSYLKLRCEVLGANIVKSDSRTFAVYSISVTDVCNNNWTIKRRFRHFEDLHKRLKEFPEFNLSLPPKHFLSSGLDLSVVQERCKSLDRYLKNLLQLPTVSGSIEVWDFLSVDSQTYNFSNYLSVIETLSVDLDDKMHEKGVKFRNIVEATSDQLLPRGEHSPAADGEHSLQTRQGSVPNGLKLKARSSTDISATVPGRDCENLCEDNSESESDGQPQNNVSLAISEESSNRGTKKQSGTRIRLEAASDPTIPTEWVPPNLSIPILDMVDVLFQLQDGGWIRRQAFWVAKQVLQLGMGDAFDDWLIEKIQLLRKGAVIASAINRLEQILWPDGIFISKHPKRRRPAPAVSPSHSSHHANHSAMASTHNEGPDLKNIGKESSSFIDEQQEQEAARRAKFVYEIMIDNAPPALVGLVGRKEYQRCVEDVYFFLQSAVCSKQLGYELLELLILSAVPELDDVVKQCHIEKDLFGELEL